MSAKSVDHTSHESALFVAMRLSGAFKLTLEFSEEYPNKAPVRQRHWYEQRMEPWSEQDLHLIVILLLAAGRQVQVKNVPPQQ